MWTKRDEGYAITHSMLNADGDDYWIVDSPNEPNPVMAEVYVGEDFPEQLYLGDSVKQAKRVCEAHQNISAGGCAMKVLDLFSGIGGFSLGLERAGMETVAFCEFDKHAQKVLKKHWPEVPIFDDVRTLDGRQFRGAVDVVCGGFPCQDISVAGSQAGLGEGTRSGLWSECARLIGEIRPKYAIFENVTALLNGGGGDWFKRVLWDISSVGYDAEWHCIPASELGAHHHRDRIWIIAYPKSISAGGLPIGKKSEHALPGSACKNVANPKRQRQPRQGQYEQSIFAKAFENRETVNAFSGGSSDIWKAEPELGRVADGIPNRSHRLKQLGNAVVPQIPELIGRAIMEIENENQH